MAFEPIPLKQQVRVEAVQAKTFDSLWPVNIHIIMPEPTSPSDPLFATRQGSIYIEYCPHRTSSGELHRASAVEIRCEQLWDAVAKVQELSAAVEALRAAVRPLEEFVNG